MERVNRLRTYEDAVAWLRANGFDLADAGGGARRLSLKKYNCLAAIEPDPDNKGARISAFPAYLIGGEAAKLVNGGYQQFLKTSKTEVPATADHLKALHRFSEELKEALGMTSLYNESLGTVSTGYNYDRVHGREPGEQQNRPWEKSK